MHESLSIVRGVMKTPGDTLSAENETDAINLMDSLGFMIEPDGWQPQLPSLKGGGVWADSAVNTGRLLVAGQDSNVTETIRLTISLGDYVSLYSMIARLQRFITECREMWTTFYQIEPVFLAWKAVGAPDSQYALIFNIDVDIQYPDIEQSPTADITLTLEREPYWRALPPGMNPKAWAYYARDENIDSLSDWALLTGTNEHFYYTATPVNRHEWTSSFTSNPTAVNYFDIPAEDIPGDVDALVEIAIDTTSGVGSYVPNDFYLGRTTKKLTYLERIGGTTLFRHNMLVGGNAGDKSGDSSIVNDTGGLIDITSAVNRHRIEVDFSSTAALALRLGWTVTNNFDTVIASGRYAVFVRARQVGGASGDITLQIRFAASSTQPQQFILPVVTAVVNGTSGNTGAWPVHYMGQLTLPTRDKTIVNPVGLGIGTDTGAQGTIQLYAQRLTGVGELYIADVILMPFDECLSRLVDSVLISSASGGQPVVLDDTGYLSHGGNNPSAISFVSTGTGVSVPAPPVRYIELRGQAISLKPGVTNRIFLLAAGLVSGVSVSDVLQTFTIRLNIIPRWKGIRDS